MRLYDLLNYAEHFAVCLWQVAECDHVWPLYMRLLFHISIEEREEVGKEKYLEMQHEVCYMPRMGELVHVNVNGLEVRTSQWPSCIWSVLNQHGQQNTCFL